MDLLSDILRTLRLRAEVFLHACFRGDWAVDTSGQRRATFHMVARGGAWLHMPKQEEPIALTGGDLLVFPHDSRHTLSNRDLPPADDVPRNRPSEPDETGPAVTLICGYFDFDRHSWNPLLESLPQVILIRNDESASVPLMESLGRIMAYETEQSQIGSSLLVDKLSEILFIHVIRSHMRDCGDQGFIAAFADSQIGKALSAIHQNPAKAWSVERLAGVAGMSRSAFAARFNQLAGMTPMHYLTRWRMAQANERFLTSDQSVAQVAELSGYQSEAAFAKVFKKQFGYGPGEARKKRGNA